MIREWLKKRSHNKKWKGFDRSQYTHERPEPKTKAPDSRGFKPPRGGTGEDPYFTRLPQCPCILPMPKVLPPAPPRTKYKPIEVEDDWPEVGSLGETHYGY